MAHAVSALYSKFNRMSPVAAAMAAGLHALVALAFLWELPRHEAEAAERAIEFTVEMPSAPPAEAQAPAPAAPPPQAAAPTPSVPPGPPPRLGLALPRSLTPDPSAKPAAPQPGPTPQETPTETTEPAKEPAAEPAKQEPAKPEPEQQQAAATPPPPPPPPPEPKLEQVLPPVEAPPPPLTAQDFPKPAPPPPPKPPPPKAPPPPPPPQRAQVPPPPQQRLQPSPLSRAPQQRPPADSQAAARPAPSPLTNPSSQYGQRKAEEDYLWLVIRKLSQYRYYPKSNVVSEEGVVVMRITIARDGRLLDVTLARSSGYPNLDNGIMDTLRQAAPFARLPADIPGDRHTFVLPLNYTPHQR